MEILELCLGVGCKLVKANQNNNNERSLYTKMTDVYLIKKFSFPHIAQYSYLVIMHLGKEQASKLKKMLKYAYHSYSKEIQFVCSKCITAASRERKFCRRFVLQLPDLKGLTTFKYK